MGRKTKTPYARTGTIKVRASAEHIELLAEIRQVIQPVKASEADIISWALEELALKHCKGKIKFIPDTRPNLKTKTHGKEIQIGKNYSHD